MQGLVFTRLAIATAMRHLGIAPDDGEYAAQRWGEKSAPAMILRGAVQPGTSSGWGSELSARDIAIAEFFALLRAKTIVGRLPGLRRVPFNVPLLEQASKAIAHWVGETAQAPLSGMSFERTSYTPHKVVALMATSIDLLKYGGDAEVIIRDELVRAAAEAVDLAFIDPGNAGSAETPAAVTNGITPAAGTGDFTADAKALVEGFAGDLDAACWVGDPKLFAALNGVEHPNIGARGGEILGLPALPSSAVPKADGDHQLALIDPTGIAYGERDVTVSASQNALINMVDASGGNYRVSMFQTDSVAIAALVQANWKRARADCVSLLSGIDLGGGA